MRIFSLVLCLFYFGMGYSQADKDNIYFSASIGYGLNLKADFHRGGQKESIDLNNSDVYSLYGNFGYYISKYNTSIGVYFGLDGYDAPVINTAPIGLNLRYFLFPGNKAIFFNIDWGGLIDIGTNSASGNSFNLGVGKRLGWKNNHPYISINYSRKKVNFSVIDPISISSVVFRLGLDF